MLTSDLCVRSRLYNGFVTKLALINGTVPDDWRTASYGQPPNGVTCNTKKCRNKSPTGCGHAIFPPSLRHPSGSIHVLPTMPHNWWSAVHTLKMNMLRLRFSIWKCSPESSVTCCALKSIVWFNVALFKSLENVGVSVCEAQLHKSCDCISVADDLQQPCNTGRSRCE